MSQTPPESPTPPTPPTFDPTAEHHQRPKLRPVRAFPVPATMPDGSEQTLLGLADASQVSEKMVALVPASQVVLPLLDGQRTLDEVVAAVGKGLTREILEGLVAQLDDAGLLFGPRFDEIEQAMQADFDGADHLPPGATAAFADALVVEKVGKDATDEQKAEMGAEVLSSTMDLWIDKALEKVENPSFDALPKAIIAPHIDFGRGWINYASVYGRLRVVDRPDRVIILGTNHFGRSSGICCCDKGYESPLGICPVDTALLEALRDRLGPENAAKLCEHRYDHEREHSIELQIPWIQHCLGVDEQGDFCKVLGILVHDPSVNNGESYDGKGLALQPFLTALREAIEAVGGTTLIVSSADLSHIGKAFGDDKPLLGEDPQAEVFRNKTVAQDQELLELIRKGKADDLIASMAWQQNPTRWCSTGNIVAAMKLTESDEIEILHYAAAIDPQGLSMVSSCAGVMR